MLGEKDIRSILLEVIESDGSGGYRLKTAAGNSSSSSAVTSVSSDVVSQTLKAANPSRKSLYVVNESTSTLFIKYGANAATNDYTIKLSSGDIAIIDDWSGIIDGVWDVANGSARITELT